MWDEKHLSEEILNMYLDGELSAEERGRVEVHLDLCRACREEVLALQELFTALHELVSAPAPDLVESVLARIPPPTPANGLARWRWPLSLGVALEAVVTALLLWLNWRLVVTFVRGLIPTATLEATGQRLADQTSAWSVWLMAQATLIQARWQELFGLVSSLKLRLGLLSWLPMVQAIVLLVAVLLVWAIANRILVAISLRGQALAYPQAGSPES